MHRYRKKSFIPHVGTLSLPTDDIRPVEQSQHDTAPHLAELTPHHTATPDTATPDTTPPDTAPHLSVYG